MGDERKLRVRIAADRCMGHGRCVALAPSLFDEDEEGFGVVRHGTVAAAQEDVARLAALSCPERAIAVVADRPPKQAAQPRADGGPT